jgi:hypothetical protein
MVRPTRIALIAAVMLTLGLHAEAAGPVPVAVTDGRAECVLATAGEDCQYLMIVAALGQGGRPYQVHLATAATDDPESIKRDQPPIDSAWQAHVRDLAVRQAIARRQNPADDYPPLKDPPMLKAFYLFDKDGDFKNTASYSAVSAKLAGLSRNCQVYVDLEDGQADPRRLEATIHELLHQFETRIRPSELGTALDVDRDGRFTILLSGRLGQMQSGKVRLSGFVRGSDFYRDMPSPYGNRCDMMYLNTDLQPGPYLRSIAAHEYTHAVMFSEHVFGTYLPGAPKTDEESWINEAVSHVVEDDECHGGANLDYRIAAFLSAPERYALVVPDYYARKLWRDPGSRGCAFLFLRWCVDRFGPELLTKLVRSNLSGVENLEVATQTPFAELFRQWTIALAVSGTGYDAENGGFFEHFSARGRLGNRLLCGPQIVPIELSAGDRTLEVGPTAAQYILLHSPAGARSRVIVSGEPDAKLQVTLLRLPDRLPRLELECETDSAGAMRVSLTCRNAGVHLIDAAWEHLVTREEAKGEGDTSFRRDEPLSATARSWFGQLDVAAGETVRSAAIAIPEGGGEIVVKVLAVDDAGRRVGACKVVR